MTRKHLKDKTNSSRILTPRLFQTSLLYQTKEFFDNSTLHGVRYIAEQGRPFGEKFMWFCFTSIGAVAAFIIIVSLWEKFQTNPTITGLDTDFHNQQVIFPTVMVCPTDPFDEEQISDVAYKVLGEYDPDSIKYEPFLQALTRISYGTLKDVYDISINVSNEKIFEKNSLRKLAFRVALKCEDLFQICKYRDEEVTCCEHFIPLYNEHGFCYAFNSRYKETETTAETNPVLYDLFETDKKWALSFTLTKQSYVFVHSYIENSGWDFRPQLIWDINYIADLLISMKQTYTTEDAKQLSIGQRKCIFPNEIKLNYFHSDYTFTNCMMECRINKCMKLCKCIPPFYRPIPSLPYCTILQLDCLNKHVANITNIKDCTQCELSCHNTVYDIEKLSKTTTTDANRDESYINIEYLTWPIIRYKREVLFGWVDLLVSFGGIAGLFLGFSLLSGVEIIYYFTLRACCMLYKDHDELRRIVVDKLRKPMTRYNLSLKIKKNIRSTSMPPIAGSSSATDFDLALNFDKEFNQKNNRPSMSKRLNMASLKILALKNLSKPKQHRKIFVVPYKLDEKTRSRSEEQLPYMP